MSNMASRNPLLLVLGTSKGQLDQEQCPDSKGLLGDEAKCRVQGLNVAMASTLVPMASNLIAMASTPVAMMIYV